MAVARNTYGLARLAVYYAIRLHLDERGVFAVSHLATTMFLSLTLLCLLNVGGTLVDRTRQQRMADAVAESLGSWKARNLNAVVAQQHLIGEMLAMVIIHDAIGGRNLDTGTPSDTGRIDRSLTAAYVGALACIEYPPFAYDDVRSPVFAARALLKSHSRLKTYLTYVYYAKAIAARMIAFPPTRPAGLAIAVTADHIERRIQREWETLEAIRKQARELSPLKVDMLTKQLLQAKRQLDRLVANYGFTQRQLADCLEERLQVSVHILPSDQSLPVIPDPLAPLAKPPTGWRRPTEHGCPTKSADNMRHQLAKVSQLTRATFPWVNYHRRNLVIRMSHKLWLCGMAEHYFDSTAGTAKEFAAAVQEPGAQSLALYTLVGYDGPDKGHEQWTKSDGDNDADRAFGITVLVGRPTREPAGGVIFRRQPEDMTYRYASAFVWNRVAPKSPQLRIDLYCKRIVPSTQAVTGWDTLNWSPETRVSELVGIGIPHIFPRIEPKWTSQLSPTSPARIQQLQSQPLPPWARELRNVLPDTVPPNLTGI